MKNETAATQLLAALLALGLAPAGVAGRHDMITIDYPGAVSTRLTGINDSGHTVGWFTTSDNKTRGFLLKDGEFRILEYQPGIPMEPRDINQAGDIVGFYAEADGRQHGLLLSGGRYTTIDYPGAEMTRAVGLNNKGDVVGMYFNRTGDTKHRGFLLSGGQFTSVDYPELNRMACLFHITDQGDAIGHWQDNAGILHGLRFSKGKLTSYDVPGASWTTYEGAGISATGDVAGPYRDLRGKTKIFVLSGAGALTRLDIPGAQQTVVLSMNSVGHLVGYYIDAGDVSHGLLVRPAPAVPRVLTVDDDGADCPGALRTIQEAVAQAPGGATILVCPGIYSKTVTIAGPEKNGLKLIARGRENEVILQGDYTERDGFHLENVSNVLIRGFTVRDFGNKPTTTSEWGTGNQIYLENAHYNTIEQNTLINGDMMGILLMDSGNNVIQQNTAFVDNANLANCGIHVEGAKSAGNTIRQNMMWGNKVAGIMIRGAGPGNRVQDNTVLANGRFGIDVQNTSEIWIEGNRVSYNRGFWGATPGGQQPGLGINLVNVNKATVFDNRARNNTGGDLSWDGKGENKLEANACDTSTPAGACGR